MGLSQQIGASSLIKPGVIDNSAQRPASPYEGQVIFQKDTDQLLVWNGTAWVIPNAPAQNPMGLELVTAATFTGQTSFSVSDVFNSTYSNYRVLIGIDSASTSADRNITWRFRTTAGDDSTAIYYYGANVDSLGSTTSQRQGAFNATNAVLVNYYGYPDSTSGVTIDVIQPFSTTIKSRYFGNAIGGNISSMCTGPIACNCTTAKSHTGFSFFSSTGTITGAVTVYGYRN